MTTLTAADVLGSAYFGATVWVQVTNDDGVDWPGPRPPEGTYEAEVIRRVDSPPQFTVTLRAKNGWTFEVRGDTVKGWTELLGWRSPMPPLPIPFLVEIRPMPRNEKNVEALTELLSDYIMGEGHGTDLDNLALADWLAARGVLVPSALTWQEVAQLAIDLDDIGASVEQLPLAVRELERLARGEVRPRQVADAGPDREG